MYTLLIRSPAHEKSARDIYFYNTILVHIRAYTYTYTHAHTFFLRYIVLSWCLFTFIHVSCFIFHLHSRVYARNSRFIVLFHDGQTINSDLQSEKTKVWKKVFLGSRIARVCRYLHFKLLDQVGNTCGYTQSVLFTTRMNFYFCLSFFYVARLCDNLFK